MKKKILKILAAFFVIMICCTVTARAADSFTVAKVQTSHVKSGKLTTKFSGNGSILLAPESISQSLPEGQKIKKVLKKLGELVHEGDNLVELDLEYLAEQVKKQSQTLEKLELQVKQQEIAGQQENRIPETASADISLQAAERALNNAQDKYQQSIDNYNAFVTMDWDEMSEEERQSREQKTDELNAETDSCLQAVESAREAYEQAVASYNLAARQEEIAKENDIKKVQSAKFTLDALKIDLADASEKLSRLTELQKGQGLVKAKQEGIFSECTATEGSVTTGSEQILLSLGGFEASGTLDSQSNGIVSVGDKVDILLQGKSKPIEVTVDRIALPEDAGEAEAAGLNWYAKLEGAEFQEGTGFTWNITKNSEQEYAKLIPLSALHSVEGENYVLKTEMRAGILGDSYTAVKVPVTILAKDGENAAIDEGAALDKEILFITSSNKYVEEGDRIRLSES